MMPYLRVANVFDGRIDFSNVLEMNFTPGERSTYSVRNGDILLNEGQSLELVGRCAKYEGSDGEYCFQNTLIRYRCLGLLDPDFAYQVFSWWLKLGRFADIAKQTTSIAHLGADRFAAMLMRVPPMGEQNRIVNVLGSVDEAIRSVGSIIAKLNHAKSGLLVELLSRGIDANGRVRALVGDWPEARRAPEGWRVGPMREVIPTVDYGVSFPLLYGVGTPVLRMNNISDGKFVLRDLKAYSGRIPPSLFLRPGDVLFNRTNSMEHVGRTAVWRGMSEPFSFASYLVRLVNDSRVVRSEYLSYWLNLPSTQLRVRAYATPGVQQVNVNPTNLRKVPIAFPLSVCEQDEIVSRIRSIDDRLGIERRGIEKMHRVKQGLMGDLLSGRVRV